jgi:acyl-CoA thioester hydrolase
MDHLLSEKIKVNVRFNEADPLGMVWHGHYIRYLEDGREAFGNKYGIGYMDFYDHGYIVPVVHVECNYKQSLHYGDEVIVEIQYEPCEAAKLRFKYILYNAGTNDLVATGSSVQVFLDRDSHTLQLTNPSFFEEWKKKYNVADKPS